MSAARWFCVALLLLDVAPIRAAPVVIETDEVAPEATLVVPLHRAKLLRMSSGKGIKRAVNTRKSALRVRAIDGDPTALLLVGYAAGPVRLELEDVDGAREIWNVTVQAINATQRAAAQVQLDVSVTRAEPGTARSFKKELVRWQPVPNVKRTEKGGPNYAVLSSADQAWEFTHALQRLELQGKAKALVQPRLVTRSGQPASLLDGGEQAVPVPAGLGQVGVQFEEFGTRLNFLPIVLDNGSIHLEVEPEVSSMLPGGRDTQRIHTTTELKRGQSVVLVLPYFEAGTTEAVPVLEGLPYIGPLFRYQAGGRWRELIIMVTPAIVEPYSPSPAR